MREVARRRELTEDGVWQHITHCSPCYATFLQFKNEFRSARRRRGLGFILAAIAVVALTAGIAIYETNHRGEPTTVQNDDQYESARLDLRDRSSQRTTAAQSSSPAPLFLPRKKLNLTIILPFGSEPGNYEVQIRKSGQELATVEGTAVVIQGNTELPVKLDLSKYAYGVYGVAIRQPSSTWAENPVTLR